MFRQRLAVEDIESGNDASGLDGFNEGGFFYDRTA